MAILDVRAQDMNNNDRQNIQVKHGVVIACLNLVHIDLHLYCLWLVNRDDELEKLVSTVYVRHTSLNFHPLIHPADPHA